MINERENFFQPLTSVDYDIAGNSFRAFYDADKKLVFVIDFLINDIKPNVLLVINPVGDRKWDDILENDYGVDLETVRPKKDNKYQKLDIEYAGLAQYDDLIHAYETDSVLNTSLNALSDFRNVAAKRAAIERLDAAELTVARSRETIDKTNEKIEELQNRTKTLRQKLADAKRAIGKEPTKQSAARILRIESQIDSVNEKLKRAKKRLANANHRLATAEDEIDVAQSILEKLDVNLPGNPASTEVMVAPFAPVPAEITNDIIKEQEAEDMADEEVKPLFDTDPNIIDEEIAFKPIDFNTPVVMPEPVAPAVPMVEPIDMPDIDVAEEQEALIQPLSFVPPTDFAPDDIKVEAQEEVDDVPAFEGFTPIPVTEQHTEEWKAIQSEAKPVQDVLEPVASSEYKHEDIEVAPVSSDFRPVSPVTHEASAVVVPGMEIGQHRAKPTMLYYVLLVVLIVLSVFTLWFYQKSANDSMPELGVKTEPVTVTEEIVVEPAVVPEPVDVEPVAIEPEVVTDIEPSVVEVTEPVVETAVEAEVVEVTEPEPEIEPETVVEDDSETNSPFVELETLGPVIGPMVEAPAEEQKVVLTEEEILASKPAYGTASKTDEMFVAAPEYETEAVVVKPAVEVVAPVVEINEPEIIAEYEEQTVVEVEEKCSDGNPPDSYGCCAGEEFVLLPDGERACCAIGTEECFPPM